MASSRQIEQAAAAWLVQHHGADWDNARQQQLDAWLAQSTAHRVAYLRLESAWQESGRLAALGAGQDSGSAPPRGQWSTGPIDRRAAPRTGAPPMAAPGLPDVAQLVFKPRSDHRSVWPHRLAAAAFSLMLAASVLAGWHWLAPVEQATYLSALGDLREVPLSDGSRATLSSDTQMAVRLSRAHRSIDLQRGEAFFDVAKDPGRPFEVDAGMRRVVAVGTRFSVRRDGPDLRVVVTEGTVRLETQRGADGHAQPTTLLPAGSIAIATRDGVVVRAGSVADAERLMDWRSGYLAFRDTSLAEAAAEFNRYNPRKIVIGDAAVGALRVGGNFRWSNTDAFVRLLEQGFPVRAERRAEQIVLHSQ